jgi:two-component system, NarL family, response regulator DevR
MTDRRIRLLLIDDHPLFRIGVTALLKTVPTMEVVGEGASTSQAVELAHRLQPDVILMDVRLRPGSGIEACREIRQYLPNSQILMFSSFSDQEAVIASLLAGASGYVLKDVEPAKLIEAIEIVADGGSLLDSTATQALLTWMRHERSAMAGDPLAGLTVQERNILPLIAEGKMNREIATTLSLSEHTVKTYISNVLQKLQMTRRSELAAFITRLQQSTPIE